MTDAVVPFVLVDSLSDDLGVLEASAGTGKTFTLAALSTAAVGRGDVSVGELCVATFTEAATAELRGRLRQRMVDAVAYLDRRVDRPPEDELERLIDSLTATERAEWLEQLRVAVREFDTASITTIHGFCSRVVSAVAGLGAGATLTADDADVDEVVRDVLLDRIGRAGTDPLEHSRLLAAVKLQLSLPAAEPDRFGPGDPRFVESKPAHVERARRIDDVIDLVDRCVDEVRRRRAARLTRTFDDLLADTRRLLLSPDGAAVARELRRRFRLVMVDEFQDTDRVQWDILRTAFVDPIEGADVTRMVIVGDPKQSIYRFRAAELSAYLAARDHAVERGGVVRSLVTNYRTDQPLLDALNALFLGHEFGRGGISYRSVRSVDPSAPTKVRGCGDAVLQFRRPGGDATDKSGVLAAVIPDLSDVVVDLLSGPEMLVDGAWRPIRPSDIAVLVTANSEALDIVAALRRRNVPAVASSSDSVLDSAAAAEWRLLLMALDRPSFAGAVRRAALSWFDSFDATSLAALDEPVNADRLASLFDRYREWSRLLIDDGLPALLSALRAHGLSRRVLSLRGGERNLTDLEHIAELLQTRTGGRSTTAGTLLELLDELAGDNDDDEATSSELYDRRIDRDDDTVRVMTIHKAKGLEFGIVLVPSMWQSRRKARTKVAHAEMDGVRRLDLDYVVGSDAAPKLRQVHDAAIVEEQEEERRKLYVALTRAKHRLVVWFPTTYTWAQGTEVALRELLLERTASSLDAFDPSRLVAEAGSTIEFVDAPAEPHGRSLARIERIERDLSTAAPPDIDRRWKRWSFTGFTREMGDEPSLLPVPIVAGGFDEPSVTDEEAPDLAPDLGLPLRTMVGGRAFGTLVHEILERVDFAVPDDSLVAALRDECGRSLKYRSVRGIDPDRLAEGLAVALRAPLGGDLGARSLTHLTRRDRLDELNFDLPLARFDLAEVAEVVLPHLAADDDVRPWFEAAIRRHLPVEGVLNGSIDLVARTHLDGRDRFWLADYKTNVIADGIDFDRIDLVGEMVRDDYVLQSTLYQVALHRLLRWRLGPVYDPRTDLLGSAYLFVRGMDPARSAADTRGVLWWKLPFGALEALDALFATAGERAA